MGGEDRPHPRPATRSFELITDSGVTPRAYHSATLLTDGRDVYGRTPEGDFYNLLRNPLQPLLMLADVEGLRELTARTKSRRRKSARTRTA